MSLEKIEESFALHLEAIQLLQNTLSSSFLDAYVENVENIIDDFQVRVIEGVPDEVTVKRLQKIYQQLTTIELSVEEKRKVSQLLLLKGMQTEPLQPNHQLTPDGLGFLFVYLIEQLYPESKQALTVLDLTAGLGNLLATILANLKLAGYQTVQAIGVDNDETLLGVAAANAEWLGESVQLFHQDGLQDLLIEPTDVAVSDLPIGYYPDDEKAQKFVTGVPQGHSYAHHLLMEQSMKYVKEAGFGLFLIPANFMQTEQSEQLKNWLQTSVYVQGIIELPDDLFRTEASRKSILILQNKGEQAQQAAQVLLAKITNLKHPETVTTFFKQFEQWKQENL